MQLCLYKAPGNMYDRLIRWRTGSPYSHVELRDENLPVLLDGAVAHPSWSSSPRDGGYRHKLIHFHDGNWDFIQLPRKVSPFLIAEFGARTHAAGYDWLGIMCTHILPLNIQHTKRFICTEWCILALAEADYPLDIHPMSTPGQLANCLINTHKLAFIQR